MGGGPLQGFGPRAGAAGADPLGAGGLRPDALVEGGSPRVRPRTAGGGGGAASLPRLGLRSLPEPGAPGQPGARPSAHAVHGLRLLWGAPSVRGLLLLRSEELGEHRASPPGSPPPANAGPDPRPRAALPAAPDAGPSAHVELDAEDTDTAGDHQLGGKRVKTADSSTAAVQACASVHAELDAEDTDTAGDHQLGGKRVKTADPSTAAVEACASADDAPGAPLEARPRPGRAQTRGARGAGGQPDPAAADPAGGSVVDRAPCRPRPHHARTPEGADAAAEAGARPGANPPVDYVARILAAVARTPLHSARGVFKETGGNKQAVFETLKAMLADGRLVTDSEGAYQVANQAGRVG